MKTVSITTKIAGVKLDACIFNTSGPADATLGELEIIARSQSPAITMKSCTLAPREGNPEPRYADLEYGSINSMGLPNLGYKAYIKFAARLKRKYKKPTIASICGMTLAENVTMFKAFNNSAVDIIEFNPGSPNTIGKPIVGYDAGEMDRLLDAVSKVSKKPYGVKLPPYFDLVHFDQIAAVIKKYPVKFVTCINSIGNGLVINPYTEQPLIKPKGGLGGISGKYIKYTTLANVRRFYELFEDKIQVIGVGGVYSGIDAFELILCGASAVQVGTAFLQNGPGIFERIQNELKDFMAVKGYKKIADFRGKLKTL
ncbi:dihydroorotate oxidase [Candidatus Curtissbacteria bacterium]|nr:dihydroorotate oxidase [Candidatus Curtissbacteria bacterium]